MVNEKGAGYALEAIAAVATVLIFILGGLNIPQNQNWDEFRTKVSAEDLTYSLKSSGYLDHAVSEGNIGSIQSAIKTISERNPETSGFVSNLPIAENSVAFYTRPPERYTQAFREVKNTDDCDGDLSEISKPSEEPVLRNNLTDLGTIYPNETLYIGDLDPDVIGGNSETDYDSIWVDNGTECVFNDNEGPYRLDQIIKWGNSSYDVKVMDGQDKKVRLFNATQAVTFRSELRKPVNSVETFVNVDAVNFTDLNSSEHNVAVLRRNESLNQTKGSNLTEMKEFMKSGSVLALADTAWTDFQSDDFLAKAGFHYPNTSYKGSYSGSETRGVFSSKTDSQDLETYFRGLGGSPSALSIKPSGAISNTSTSIESTRGLLHSSSYSYNLSEWNRYNYSLNNATGVAGAPTSACYDNKDEAMTNGTLKFPNGETYGVLNVELGATDSYCSSNNTRALEIDIDQDGDYLDPIEGPYLNDQVIEVASRKYAVDIINHSSNPSCGEGECAGFRFVGDREVELVARRKSFPEFKGQRMALTGYEENYEVQDLKLLAALIHWLRGDSINFEGLSSTEAEATSIYSAIEDRTYMPYEVDLRWSQ